MPENLTSRDLPLCNSLRAASQLAKHSLCQLLCVIGCVAALIAPAGVSADRLLPGSVDQFDTGNRAANALIHAARRYVSNGALDSAASELERAIRISPRSALTWHELARIRFVQGNHADAESLAKKAAVLMEPDDTDLKQANERLRLLSSRAQGKEAGQQSVAQMTAAAPQQPSVPTSSQGVAQTVPATQSVSNSTLRQQARAHSVQPVAVTRKPAPETVLSPARPLGGNTSISTGNTQPTAEERTLLAHGIPRPAPQVVRRSGSGPAQVVDRSAPRVKTTRLIKRRTPTTRRTLVLFQARRGAPVVEKSLIYQHPQPSPVAMN